MSWQPIETAPKDHSILLKFPGDILCSGRQRYGYLGEPQQDCFAWRCDCCGRFATPVAWMEPPQ